VGDEATDSHLLPEVPVKLNRAGYADPRPCHRRL
jgi:hypothetical protein